MSAWLNTYLVYDIVCSSRSYPFPGMNTSFYPYSTFSIPSSKITNLYNLQLSPFPTIANVVYMAFRATEFTYLVQPLIYLQNIGCYATVCIAVTVELSLLFVPPNYSNGRCQNCQFFWWTGLKCKKWKHWCREQHLLNRKLMVWQTQVEII